MKKIVFCAMLIGILASSAYAMSPEESEKARYQEMKKIKDAQRAARLAEQSSPSMANKTPGFWEKEGERSGLGETGNRISSFFGGLVNPTFFQDQEARYKARKAAAK